MFTQLRQKGSATQRPLLGLIPVSESFSSTCSQVVQQYTDPPAPLLQESMSRSLLNRYLDDLIQKPAAAPKKHDF